MQIRYLDHSGFLVKQGNNVYIFDYSNNQPVNGKMGEDGGVIDISQFANNNIFVFVSHRHADHFKPEIFNWKKQAKNINYIISKDIRPPEFAVAVQANEQYSIGDVVISTLKSTDEGVAFLVESSGKRIYHAGDLNWWHWEGEQRSWNRNMEILYKAEIEKLRDIEIDIAFVPVDTRLGEQMLWGIDWLMKIANIKKVIPMHYWGGEKEVEQAFLQLDAVYKDRLVLPMRRGQAIDL